MMQRAASGTQPGAIRERQPLAYRTTATARFGRREPAIDLHQTTAAPFQLVVDAARPGPIGARVYGALANRGDESTGRRHVRAGRA